MHENTREAPDIGRIVSLIMENPKLIEEISNLSKKTEASDSEGGKEANVPEADNSTEASPAATQPTDGRERRAHLLGALKPYVSSERARAIDSMISIADMLDMMRAR